MKKPFKYALLLFLVLLVASLLTEALLGIAFHYKDKGLEPMAVHDFPYLYYLFDESEGLNEHGFKTKYPLTKQSGRFRIILTGGSVARGKHPNESIAHFLEKELSARLQTDRVEVINAGMSAFVAEQEFILLQLILQHYEPDMVVSLDGYNDMMTFKLNRQFPAPFALPPHNWQDFRVISENRDRRKPGTRFPLFFRNISRVLNYMDRKNFEKTYDWQSLTDEKLQPFSDTYWRIIHDSYDFCKAKHISYYSFLQPVRFYNPANNADDETTALSRLYSQMEEGVNEKHYAFTLTSVFGNRPGIFTDECHVTPEGNRMIAAAMADRIEDEVGECLQN